ncbi:hemerythrin domain-containing protein [Pelosinus sp. sgz500959]|uniref:hemerythrin domain-containing protein n=1 Tax=Pelosinus sp. sgz500959 TaxID=3242472 RepID=UPI003670337C
MVDTTNLVRQHQEQSDLINKIAVHKSEQQVKDNASHISLLLSQLAGKLKMHAIAEDQFLYPTLMNHADPKVKATAQAFYTEMGGLAKTFEGFKNNFMTAKTISSDPENFLVESKKILSALNNRIVKENKELYPLLTI